MIPKNQLWVQHPDMRARISRAEADFASGRITTAASPEEAQRVLDSFKDLQTLAPLNTIEGNR